MKKRIAALAIGLSALAAMPALAETMRFGDSAAVTGVKDNIVLRAMPDTEADELAQIASEESVTYLSPEKDGFAQVEYDGMRGYVPAGNLTSQTAHGAAFSITDEERSSINLFLSNFTEQGMLRYDENDSEDEELVRFSVWHIWFNQHDRWESGEWGNNNRRLSDKGIADVAQKYFGRRPLLLDLPEMDYDGDYYYFEETGGNMGIGFACLSSVEALGGGLYRVYFGVYGEGEAWNAADCTLLPEQAANLYDQTPPRQGCAVIRSLGLDSQNGMTLSRLLIE